jgi:large subunit ribosomal protein L31e
MDIMVENISKVERIYNVPLGKAYQTISVKRTNRAVKLLKEFISRHSKVAKDSVRLSNNLNKSLWQGSRKNPPRSMKIKVIKEGNIAKAYLVDEKIEEKKIEEKKPEEKKPEESKKPEEVKKQEKPAAKPEVKNSEAKKEEAPKIEENKEAKPAAGK